jgi:Cdc6-like AAA superfamily ATPase
VVDVSVVSLISPTARLVLLAALVHPKCYGRADVETREVYAEYTRLSAIANAKPVTYRQFTTIIKQLEDIGVIERSVWSVGRYGKMSVLKVRKPDRIWRGLREDLALGELAERLCTPSIMLDADPC